VHVILLFVHKVEHYGLYARSPNTSTIKDDKFTLPLESTQTSPYSNIFLAAAFLRSCVFSFFLKNCERPASLAALLPR